MSIQDVSSQSTEDEPRYLPPEVDKFVDFFLSTMCESSRRHILELLAQPKRDGRGSTLEHRSTDLAKALGLSPATTSQHLKQLTASGLLTFRKEGNAIYYRIRNILLVQAFHDLIAALDKEHASSLSKLNDEIVS